MGAAPRQLLSRAARRDAILRAAAAAFATKGFSATSMDDVAAAAGITKLIVYRHFASKRELYDAVLEQVSQSGRDIFVAGIEVAGAVPSAVRALLTVAREDEAGFVLLWRHAVREPQFADHAATIRQRGVRSTEELLADAGWQAGPDRRWAAETIMSYLVACVLHWLEHGAAEGDETFVERVSRSLPPMIQAWTGAEIAGGVPAGDVPSAP